MKDQAELPRSLAGLEEAFVRCVELWRRAPSAGLRGAGVAKDGPWGLMLRLRELGDYGGEGQDGVSAGRAPRAGLDRFEVAEMERVAGWLELALPEERELVWRSAQALAGGEPAVPWEKLARALELGVTGNGVKLRYRTALARILGGLHGQPAHRWRRLIRGDGSIEAPSPRFREVLFGGEIRTVGK